MSSVGTGIQSSPIPSCLFLLFLIQEQICSGLGYAEDLGGRRALAPTPSNPALVLVSPWSPPWPCEAQLGLWDGVFTAQQHALPFPSQGAGC